MAVQFGLAHNRLDSRAGLSLLVGKLASFAQSQCQAIERGYMALGGDCL